MDDQYAYATARDLAHLYKIPIGTVYRWASIDKWRRTKTWPRRYSREDAQRSYGLRRTPPGLTRC